MKGLSVLFQRIESAVLVSSMMLCSSFDGWSVYNVSGHFGYASSFAFFFLKNFLLDGFLPCKS